MDCTVCIKYPAGNVVQTNEVIELARQIKAEYQAYSNEWYRPVMFLASNQNAPLYIMACWHAGVPFYVKSSKTTPQDCDIIRRIIQPVFFISDGLIDETVCCEKSIILKKTKLERSEIEPELFSDDNAAAAWIMTSGTTGVPKVMMYQRKHIQSAVRASNENVTSGKNSFWLLMLPLNHIGGISVVLRSWLCGNGVFDARFSNILEIMEILQFRDEITIASMVPTQLIRMLGLDAKFNTHKNFRAILLGGGPSASVVIYESRKRGIPVMKSYGMTETCAQFTSVPFSELFDGNPETSGKPLPGNAIEIRSEKGVTCNKGETGYVWLKGNQIIDRYIFPEEANHAFDSNGWFNTGDYGYVDKQGYLFIQMRRSDLIVTGGENVNPFLVEQALLKIPEIKEAAVIGVDDEEWGQKVVAIIVTELDELPVAQWSEDLKKSLKGFEIPREYRRIDALPRNDLGKIKRAMLK